MTNLIPSKDVCEYLNSICYNLSDFQKATLIWNTLYNSLKEQLCALKEIGNSTNDFELKKQIEERILFEKDSIDKFKTNDGNYIYVVYNEDCDSGYFLLYDTARQYCVVNGYKDIQKHFFIKNDTLPLININGIINPYISSVKDSEAVEYHGQPVSSISFNDKYEIQSVWTNEMPIERSKAVNPFNPNRFEFAYTQIPFPIEKFAVGTIVKDLRSNEFGVVGTTSDEWYKFVERVNSGVYVDFSDYSLMVYFICRSGRWTHDHINPIYLSIEAPSNNDNPFFLSALKMMSQYLKGFKDCSENRIAVVDSTMAYAKSMQKEYTTIEEILYW